MAQLSERGIACGNPAAVACPINTHRKSRSTSIAPVAVNSAGAVFSSRIAELETPVLVPCVGSATLGTSALPAGSILLPVRRLVATAVAFFANQIFVEAGRRVAIHRAARLENFLNPKEAASASATV